MRIALVKKRYSLRHGGSERYTVNLARQLQGLGHEVAVIGEQIDDELAGEVRFLKVHANRWTSWTHNRSFAVAAGAAARREKFDIVYGIGRAFGLNAVRVTERLQSHWLRVHYGRFRQPLERLNPRHRTLIALERAIYNSGAVRRVVTQSRLDRELVRTYYGVPDEKIRTIYNGVDTQAFHPDVQTERDAVRREFQLPADAPLMVFASMDFAGKGLRSILTAQAKSRHGELHLLVLGTGPVARFSRIARELGVRERVRFAGRRADIARCYGAGDLFILPTAYEPFPNVNLEAMACGLPVLTTTTSGGADIVRHGQTGWLIPHVGAVDEMTECIDRHFHQTPAAWNTMSRRCRETACTLPIEKNIQQTLAMFEEIVHEKRAA